MSYSAKRVSKGDYTYRGYQVEEVGQYGDTPNIAQWNIRSLDEDHAHDSANTLTDAKNLIDHWLKDTP